MFVRLVSNSWPCDLPISVSQSSGITGVSHRAWPGNNLHAYQEGTISMAYPQTNGKQGRHAKKEVELDMLIQKEFKIHYL